MVSCFVNFCKFHGETNFFSNLLNCFAILFRPRETSSTKRSLMQHALNEHVSRCFVAESLTCSTSRNDCVAENGIQTHDLYDTNVSCNLFINKNCETTRTKTNVIGKVGLGKVQLLTTPRSWVLTQYQAVNKNTGTKLSLSLNQSWNKAETEPHSKQLMKTLLCTHVIKTINQTQFAMAKG